MATTKRAKLIDVTADNVAATGFFCYMSKPKAEGYQRKLNWLRARFAEGMRIKMYELPQRGFIEYIPGEYAWRTVEAKGYMFIHCLWVVGKSKGQGLGARLLTSCIKDARESGMHGVAMLTSEGNWLAGRELLLQHGFRSVAQAPPAFDLMVMPFEGGPPPALLNNWEKKAEQFAHGLTVFRSDQCPYVDDAVKTVLNSAQRLGIKNRIVELKTCEEVRNLSPSPYGVFSIVYNGELLSYHYLLEKELLQRLEKFKGNKNGKG
ncbi:GNAT family N-acetyltransferase [bacterium]|nr:GNAT family N-acetyltransferase [bacterium]